MAVVLCSLFMYLTRNIIIGPPEPRTHARISSAATVSSSHQTLTTLSKIKERNINSSSSTSSSILKTSSRAAVGPAISAPRMNTSYQFPFNFIFFASSSHRANSPSSVVPMKVCSICVINNATRILDCNHSFCSECIESYIRANEIHVHDGIQCPESGCNRVITTQKINMLFPTLLQEIRHKSYQTYGKFKRCCKICKESLAVPPDMIGLQYYHFLQCKNKPCNKSGHYTCYYCNDIVAKGAITFGTHHCVEMEGKMIKNSIGVMERSATRHCPKCFMVIVKNGGCAHMNCSTCGVRFCWDCLRIDHAETNGVCIAPIEISKARKEKATKMAVVIGSPLLLVGAIIATPFYAASKVADRIRNASEARARKKMFNTYNDILSKNAIVFKYRHNPRHLDELDPLILQWAGVNDASILSNGVEIQRVTKDDIHVTLYIGIEGNLEMPGILLPRKLEAQQNLRRAMSLDMLLQAYVVIYQEILKTSIYQYQTRRKKISSMEGVIANAIASSQQYINSNFPTDQRELLSSVLPWEETIDFFRHHVTANLPDQ